MARLDQFAAQRRVVIDRAVKDDSQPKLRIEQRLVGALRKIDNGQPAVAKGERAVLVIALAIGSAPRQGGCHTRHRVEVRGPSVKTQFTANAAHRLSLSEV